MLKLYIWFEIIFLLMSNLKRKSKEYQLDVADNFKAIYGSVDKETSDVIYIRVRGKVQPKQKQDDYSNEVLELKSSLIDYIGNMVGSMKSILNKNYIFDVDLTEKCITYKKSSHIKYDLYVIPIQSSSLESFYDTALDITNKVNKFIIDKLSSISFDVV